MPPSCTILSDLWEDCVWSYWELCFFPYIGGRWNLYVISYFPVSKTVFRCSWLLAAVLQAVCVLGMGNSWMGKLRRTQSFYMGSLCSQCCLPAEVSQVLTNLEQVWWTEIPACSDSSVFTLCLLVSHHRSSAVCHLLSWSVKNASCFFSDI